ncbi:MAG TPA: hypothetical protein VEZ48_14510 [Sphingomonadaceae bacterium]|nr:hypothetical protein [Sphingomonadaceae bacterium]
MNVERRSASRLRPLIVLAILVTLAAIAALVLGVVDIDQQKGARLPSIKVDAKGGQLPSFDVSTAKVKVGTKDASVAVPTVTVENKKTTLEVPTITVRKAGD